MTYRNKRLIALLLCMLFIITLCNTALASSNSVIIVFNLDSTSMYVDGKLYSMDKSLQKDGCTLLPLTSIMKIFGADIITGKDGKIKLVYKNLDIDITVGSNEYTVNGAKKRLDVAPSIENGVVVVPESFISENFDATINVDSATRLVTIVLEDDGALNDLSFLTKSVGNDKIGNSHFGWSISIPKGSQVNSSSFNERDVIVSNKQRGITLDISVSINEGKTLEQYIDKIKNDFEKQFYNDREITDCNIINADPKYAEFIINSSYSDDYVERIYINDKYIYHLTLYSSEEKSAEKIKENTYLMDFLNSFSLAYEGDMSGIKDLSKVVNGYVKYENYIRATYAGKPYLAWEMQILPDWYVSDADLGISSEITYTKNDNLNVNVIKAAESDTPEKYIEALKKSYDLNYNPQFYKFISEGESQIAGFKAARLTYSLELGGNNYIKDNFCIKNGNIMYTFFITTPEESYNEREKDYLNMLNTFKPASSDISKLEESIQTASDLYSYEDMRVSSDNGIKDYQCKNFNWSIKIPGYWLKQEPYFDEGYYMFIEPVTSSAVIIFSVKNTTANASLSDDDKFSITEFILGTTGMYEKEINLDAKPSINAKGITIRQYFYRYNDEENDEYGDFNFYIVDGGKYSYCFMTAVQDIYASPKNIAEIQAIWDSFTFVK